MTEGTRRRRRLTRDNDHVEEAGRSSMSLTHTIVREVVNDREEERELAVQTFVTSPAHVEIQAGLTRKLADYESLRVTVTIRVPCYKEQVMQVADEVGLQVNDLLNNEINSYMEMEESVDNGSA